MKQLMILMLCWIFFPAFHTKPPAQQGAPIQLGAYYFDGWYDSTLFTMTKKLKDSFSERKPVWGWMTSKPDVMEKQIDLASGAGITFFDFCWYHSSVGDARVAKSNHALQLFQEAPNKSKMKFCIMVANDGATTVTPGNWHIVTKEWINLFKQTEYLTIDGKPYISFFVPQNLQRIFGSTDAVKMAFDSLRADAVAAGLKGVTIGACVGPAENQVNDAKSCGYDVLTAYNYPLSGFRSKRDINPVDSLTDANFRAWNLFKQWSLPYIPTATLNWDPRPWANKDGLYSGNRVRMYKGFSEKSVEKSITLLKKWIVENPEKATKERVGMVYAWNEYGEGAWLTPSTNDSLKLLDGVKRALTENQ